MTFDAPVADWVRIPDLYTDPFPLYERLRSEGGVHWVPQVGRYLITSYAAVHETELDQEVYSADEEGSLQIRAMGHSMLRRDDPEHYRERTAWQPALRPGAVRRTWTEVFQRNAERYLEEFLSRGPEADLIWDFAAPYAAENLREIIGLHNASQEDLQRWSQTMIDATGNYADDPDVWAAGLASYEEVDIALDEMLRWHQDNPNASLLSQLLRIPDYEMPLERIRANVKMTIGGGLNEPRDALGVAAWALLTHPEQRAAVEADPSRWQSVFDESIRWVAPIGLYSRQVTRDTVLEGVRLPRGAKLGICILSANRDERVWDRPASFDIHREVKPHLAFGKGVHVCLGAWVARAEVADVALPLLFGRLEGLGLSATRTPEIRGWVFRGMTRLPVTWTGTRAPAEAAQAEDSRAPMEDTGDLAPRIVVVGSGPAGSFSAQALRRTFPTAPIDVLEGLPTPYGLVRYGVAADHQGTKSVARQFERLFLHEDVRFRGNLRLGHDVSLEELRRAYDVVVLATGLQSDAPLPVQGAHLPRVHGAGRITRLLNSHPDEDEAPRLGPTVVVVGHGNVAMDVARMLARHPDDLEDSDVADEARERLCGSVRTLHLVGRSDPASASFDPVMVRELATLRGVRHIVHGVEALPADGKDARVEAVRSLADVHPRQERVRIEWWFGLSPLDIQGTESLEAVVFEGPDGEVVLPADDLVTAIGFAADPDTPVEPGSTPDGRVEPGLYTAGWLRRGPRGTIPDQRLDARSLARAVAEDVSSGAVEVSRTGLPSRAHEVSFEGWRRIDLRERLAAAPGRQRAKLPSRTAQLQAATDDSLLPPEPAGVDLRLPEGQAMTILFATESGGAELVATDLHRSLGEDADVQIRDLDGTAPADLDPGRTHLLVCSTYGDGEVPTSARPFHAALRSGEHDLTGLRYAVFGMGDRSYTRTYSRGSELIDEAMAAAGATRFGEYGRHDASGPDAAAEAAVEWLQGVLAELAEVAHA
ncbi:cytochrome P450 [uncultured Serinicoccus sp.]|uniref:cytochrome P450 n=1 Tax=uncultured Serinicoccus sp. TaxID=735514 RepID=UPI00260FE16D|nr:cytochrome P450 [uncultured Serinicoccus sp.]